MSTVIQSHKRLSLITSLPLPSDISVERFFGEEKLNHEFTWNLYLRSHSSIDTRDWLYQKITICSHDNIEANRFFSGIISSIKHQRCQAGNQAETLHITLKSWFSLLQHETDCAFFKIKQR